jgi:predicted PhzF superfamily epimerase YddE/YHI9
MHLRYYVVDAFTARPFAGNPAAVVPLESWLPDETMAAIAREMNLSETAFVLLGDQNQRSQRHVISGEPEQLPRTPIRDPDLRIRWFTPMVEVDLCGHATLATARVLDRPHVRFDSRSGPLEVRKDGDRFVLDFPSRPPRRFDDAAVTARLAEALGRPPREVLASRDLVAIYDDAAAIRALAPDFRKLAAIDVHGVIVTAPGSGEVDFVSRFFVPQQGIDEDPVTGSAHCTLIPLWAERLGKTTLAARQLSRRGGELACALRGDRVDIGGHAVLVARGTLTLT